MGGSSSEEAALSFTPDFEHHESLMISREVEIIARTDAVFGGPLTRDRLVADLRNLGVVAGGVLLVHSSLSALGWVIGAAETVVGALADVLGPEGTIVMPAHSGQLSDPGLWEAPPVPDSWKQTIRDEMPAFDPQLTASRGIGAVPEFFRLLPGVLRSRHPMDSFAARGPLAAFITDKHSLEDGLGEESPLASLYELDARVLLLGSGHEHNTSLHLAEHRSAWPGKKSITQGSPVFQKGKRCWVEFSELDYDTADFPRCGEAFNLAAEGHDLSAGKVGLAESLLMSQRALVDFASRWFSANRCLEISGGEKVSAPEDLS